MSLLRRFSTIKIAGDAERIVFLSDFLARIEEAWPKPIRILGNGSNVLMDDRGLKGTVILTREDKLPEPKILKKTSDFTEVEISAGMFLPAICRWSQKESLTGCEYMIGVPGTLGGAVVQNAGANEQEIKDILVSVSVLNLQTKKKSTLLASECELDYRWSRFQKETGWIVLSAVLRLRPGETSLIEAQVQKNLDYRKQKTPWTRPTLGSTFTRIPQGDGWIFPGKLIEDSGLKGFKQGKMSVSDIHANYIINDGDASFEDAMKLIEEIESRVGSKTGVKLHREIQIWRD